MDRILKWWVFATVAVALNLFAASTPREFSFSFHGNAIFKINNQTFDLATDQGVADVAEHASKIIPKNSNTIEKRDRRGLKEIARLSRLYAKESDRALLRGQILEIASAIANNHRSPVPGYVGLPDLPFRFAAALHNPVAKGRKPATNLRPTHETADLSTLDPERSSYWQRPVRLASMDLHAGFGRAEIPAFDHGIWNYAGPKTSGRNPGCDLACGSQRIKVKFAETHSEPFISRIFHALGYNVDPTDYAPRLRIRYDRRFFQEFNRRPEIKMKIGVFFIPIYTFHFERSYDPFAFIESAVLKDGSQLSGVELKRFLFKQPNAKSPPSDPNNFVPAAEAQIDYLVTIEANVQFERQHSDSIGPWDFGGLGREHLREVRGAGVLAAWLGWWDSRYENTRLRLVKSSRGRELQHFFTDLGVGLGHSGGTFRHSTEDPNEFPWSFTRNTRPGNGKPRDRFVITHFEPIIETPAFKQMTFDDARWMGRLIAQLSEQQITGALIAGGFASAEVRIYTEKLLARRDQMVRDLRLDSEFQPLRREPNKEIDYDPAADGAIIFQTPRGDVAAPIGENVLRKGRVQLREIEQRPPM